MLLLRANHELKQTFDRLIETMKAPVQWNGIFAVIDNYIILQGEVRSLFFHFDSKKVVTNIIDIPVKEENVEETGDNVHVRNVINMILYVFGKWGTVNGLKVEKNYAQLNQLFTEILREIEIEPEYNQEYFRFYKDGIRITYEDVIQSALEYEEKPAEANEEDSGLWYKLVWKRQEVEFAHVETDLEERLKGRLGNNFYMVGYLCPKCGEKLHMVVYPVGKEFRIETEEGAVLLARDATCDHCNCFYTPRPEKLFSEGDIYSMPFEDDRKAYEDYLELIGKRGERVSNNRFNEFVDKKKNISAEKEIVKKEEEENEKALEEFCENLSEHSKEEIARIRERMEEGFYPDENIRRLERKIKAHSSHADRNDNSSEDEKIIEAKNVSQIRKSDRDAVEVLQTRKPNRETGDESQTRKPNRETGEVSQTRKSDGSRELTESEIMIAERGTHTKTRENEGVQVSAKEQEEVRQKFEAKLKVCDRFSDRQLKEFKEQLVNDRVLEPLERQKYIDEVEQRLLGGCIEQFSKKADACEGKQYVIIKRVFDEIAQAEIPKSAKEPLLDKLSGWMKAQGEREVQALVEKMPPNMNRAGYRQFMEKIHSYEGIDITLYEEKLKAKRELAERREVEELVKRARKITKEDYKELSKRLEEGDFLPELILPYQEKIDAKIRKMDADEIAEICLNPLEMSFEEGLEAYEKIEKGDFLPELKADALKMLSKRLSKIKTDECELLVKKLKDELQEAGIAETAKHHFYPARKVLLGQALPEETEVIDFAMASYAAGKGLFEYPILVVDITRKETGKEGMILTPDHLYYSTMLNAYGIAIASIQKITASTGILNRGIYVHEKNGTKTKIPYAVATKELESYAKVLDGFVHYLQEKPDSRKVDYLAEKKHATICCFRCGYAYKGGAVCPKCGYKNNE